MPKKTEAEQFPLRTDESHEHIWDKWYPYNNRQNHRVCLHPKCRQVEIKDVK